MTNRANQVFGDQYQVIRRIGLGGTAEVYEAVDRSTGRYVALKLMHAEEGARTERFRREIARLEQLQHPHIVRCLGGGQSQDGELYAVFEFLVGVDLSTRIEQGPVPHDVCHAVLVQVLQALSAAHASGVLHRDVKPSNIRVVSEQPNVTAKLMDFGIAMAREEAGLTETGKAVGTPRYMSPEQWLGESLGPASDIYSLGLVAYDMLWGAAEPRPMDPSVRVAIPVSSSVPTGLAQVVNKMLVPSPAGRFASCEEVLQALNHAGGPTTQVQAAQPPTRLSEAVPPAPTDEPSTLVEGVASTPAPARLQWVGYVLIVLAATGVGAAIAMLPLEPDEPQVVVRPPPTVEVEQPPEPEPELPSLHAPPEVCGAHEPGMHSAKEVDAANLIERKTTYYVPKGYDPEVPAPVIAVVFDASEIRDLDKVAAETGFDRVADRHGFVVAFIRVLDHDKAPQEVKAELDIVASKVCVDRELTFAVGSKGGGDLLVRHRCEMDLRAMATLGTRELEGVCAPKDEVPHLHFIQRHDNTAPMYEFGCKGRVAVLSVGPFERVWADRYNCSPRPDNTEPYGLRAQCRVYDGCDVPLEICEVNGGPVWVHKRKCRTPAPSGFGYEDAIGTFFSREARRGSEDPDPESSP